MNITDTCPCGARFSTMIGNGFSAPDALQRGSLTDRHDKWLAAHEVCRLREREKVVLPDLLIEDDPRWATFELSPQGDEIVVECTDSSHGPIMIGKARDTMAMTALVEEVMRHRDSMHQGEMLP